MAKPKHINLKEDGVVTQAALLAYAEGRLGDAERVEMEKLLREDPFAQEALEGLRKSKNLNEVPTAIISINTQLREKTGARERKKKGIVIHWTVYAYAALILGILIGIGFVMIHFLSPANQEMAMTVKAKEEPGPVEQKPAPVRVDSNTTVPMQSEDSIRPGTKDTSAMTGKTQTTTTAALSSNTTAADQESSLAKSDSRTMMYKENAPQTDAYHTAPAPAAAEKKETTKAKNAMSGETMAALNAAKSYFEAAEYTNAQKKYNEVLASQPDNADALYFGGICSYLNNDKGLGENNFDKLLKTGMYTEGTKWYKANILIRKGQKDAAKQLLRDLINSNSSFKDRAIKEYEELYK